MPANTIHSGFEDKRTVGRGLIVHSGEGSADDGQT